MFCTDLGIFKFLIYSHTICFQLSSNFDASEVKVCRICLANDVKMYSTQEGRLKSYMEQILVLRVGFVFFSYRIFKIIIFLGLFFSSQNFWDCRCIQLLMLNLEFIVCLSVCTFFLNRSYIRVFKYFQNLAPFCWWWNMKLFFSGKITNRWTSTVCVLHVCSWGWQVLQTYWEECCSSGNIARCICAKWNGIFLINWNR